jgi:hypothetical protein
MANFFKWFTSKGGKDKKEPEFQYTPTPPEPIVSENKVEPKVKTTAPLPINPRRVSEPSWGYDQSLSTLGTEYRLVNYNFMREVIPIVRKLVKSNPTVSQALRNIVELGNTGHKLFFDPKVSAAQVDAMRSHLNNRAQEWAPGQPNMDGLVNKMMSQVMISGALSNEWVPNNNLTGVESCILVNPEQIEFALSKDRKIYLPFQRPKSLLGNSRPIDLIPLNTNTYKYFALNGDEEIPYGYPPYMSILDRVVSENKMHQNIDFMVELAGLVGFLELLMDKPDEISGENDKNYQARLNSLLTEAKNNILTGMRDGVVVGFKDDHEFNFQGLNGRDVSGVVESYKINEMQKFSGLSLDPTIAGRDYNTSETQITVIFMKLISQLRNIQNLVKANLEFGYALDLRLSGFQFEFLNVRFRKSTLHDEYKHQQSEELKIKNAQQKYLLGITSQSQMADELDYETSDQAQPRVDLEILAGGSPASEAPSGGADAKKRQAQKGKSAKKTRSNNKPTGSKKS